MQMEQEKKEEVMVIRISGDLDAQTSPEAEERVMKLIDSGETKLVLDLTNVEYLTSAGLRLLLNSLRALEKEAGKFAIFVTHPDVIDVLKMSGLDRIIANYRSESEAIEAVKESDSKAL